MASFLCEPRSSARPRRLPGVRRAPPVSAMAHGAATRMGPHLLDGLEAGRARELLARLLPRLLNNNHLAPVVARGLRALVDGDRHQEVLSFLLDQIKVLLKSREAHLHQMIADRVREQGGRLVGWAIGGSVASRVLGAITAELERTDPHDSDLREAVTAWMRREIDLIETDPDRARELGDTVRTLFTHHSLKQWAAHVWSRARGAIEDDLGQPESWIARLVAESLQRTGEVVGQDRAVRDAIDRAARTLARRALPGLRAQLAGFIGEVVAGWDTRLLVDRLELRVGRDLQFVRINGTVVGAMVGGLLFLGLRLLLGPEAG